MEEGITRRSAPLIWVAIFKKHRYLGRFIGEAVRRAILARLDRSVLSAAPGFAFGRAYEHARARNFASRNESFARGFGHTGSGND